MKALLITGKTQETETKEEGVDGRALDLKIERERKVDLLMMQTCHKLEERDRRAM